MQTEYIEQWTELCRTFNKPLADLTELNTRTLKDFYEKGTLCFQNIISAKRPEEVVSSQMKFLIDGNASVAEYMQDLLAIIKNSSSDATKQYNRYASEAIKTGSATFNNTKNKA